MLGRSPQWRGKVLPLSQGRLGDSLGRHQGQVQTLPGAGGGGVASLLHISLRGDIDIVQRPFSGHFHFTLTITLLFLYFIYFYLSESLLTSFWCVINLENWDKQT